MDATLRRKWDTRKDDSNIVSLENSSDSHFLSRCPKKCNDLIQCALAPPLWGSDKNRYSYPEAGIRVDEATNVDLWVASACRWSGYWFPASD